MSMGSKVTGAISQHPKVAGALLATLLLLSQFGMAIGGNTIGSVGP